MQEHLFERSNLDSEGYYGLFPRHSIPSHLESAQTVTYIELKLHASDYDLMEAFAMTPDRSACMHIKSQVQAFQGVLRTLHLPGYAAKIAYPAVAHMIFTLLAEERDTFLSEGSIFVSGKDEYTERKTNCAQMMLCHMIGKTIDYKAVYNPHTIEEVFHPGSKLCPLVTTVYQTLLSMLLYKDLASLIPPNNRPVTIAAYAKEWNRQFQQALYASK